jgi:pentose-5-phosphate-3-epimerase
MRRAFTAGASLFVSGSFIFHSKDYRGAIAALDEGIQ